MHFLRRLARRRPDLHLQILLSIAAHYQNTSPSRWVGLGRAGVGTAALYFYEEPGEAEAAI